VCVCVGRGIRGLLSPGKAQLFIISAKRKIFLCLSVRNLYPKSLSPIIQTTVRCCMHFIWYNDGLLILGQLLLLIIIIIIIKHINVPVVKRTKR